MTRTTPPFRADHVGSLLRPPALKAARRRHELGEIGATELAVLEDAEIRRVIERLDGVESFRADHGIAFKGGIETQAKGLRVVGKLGFSGHPMLEHFRFLRDHTSAVPKMTIPSPSVLHFRGGRR